MARKKRQHFVPQVYLRPFTDDTPPQDWDPERPFEPTVWIAPPLQLTAFRRKAPANILAMTRLYNLRDDDPERPWLEEAFGRIEMSYGGVLRALEDTAELSVDQYGTLLIFVGALRGRTPHSIQHRQRFVDDLERIHRGLVSGDDQAMEHADQLFRDSDEGGVRSVPVWTQAYAEVIGREGFIIVNDSELPFITSDDPVCHTFLHSDERPVAAFPADRRVELPRTAERHLSFTPLSPRLAFVSSPLLKRGEGLYWETTDPAVVFAFNQLTRSRARDWMISHTDRPYGELTEAVLEAEANLMPRTQTGLKIYTEQDRYWVPTDDVEHLPTSHPLVTRLQFTTSELSSLRRIAEDLHVREVTLVNAGRLVGHLKHARFTHVATSPDEYSIIETSLEDLASGSRNRQSI